MIDDDRLSAGCCTVRYDTIRYDLQYCLKRRGDVSSSHKGDVIWRWSMDNCEQCASPLLPFYLSSSVLFSLSSLYCRFASFCVISFHFISSHFKSFLIIIFHSTIYPFIYIILIFMSLSFDVCEEDHVHYNYPNSSISNNFKPCWNLLVAKIVFIIFVFWEYFSASISIQFNETIYFPPVPNYFIFLVSSHLVPFHFIPFPSCHLVLWHLFELVIFTSMYTTLPLPIISFYTSLTLPHHPTLPCSITLLSSIYTHSQHTPHTLSTPHHWLLYLRKDRVE